MHVDQQPYRDLYDALHEDACEPRVTLASWVERHGAEVLWLSGLRERCGPATRAALEDLWRLYALARVLDVLTLPFQQGVADGSDWPGPSITLEEWRDFAGRLGLAVVVPERFTPFDCEIVSAVQAPKPAAAIALLRTHWPCLMLGDMLVLRAGTSVSGGSTFLNAEVAASSTLYWAYRRKTRPHVDLSDGWGSNSQWRTRFRRDYRVGDRTFLNVDGEHDLASGTLVPLDEEDRLTREQRIELLTHRCFVLTTKDSTDLWPWDDTLVTTRA